MRKVQSRKDKKQRSQGGDMVCFLKIFLKNFFFWGLRELTLI